ncbi:MAG: hypothetical protein Rubg2KO_09550 [Rubricoccaceae bacterium]
MLRTASLSLTLVGLAIGLAACGDAPATTSDWTATAADITVQADGCTDRIRADLYLDATSSMAGYAATPGSAYIEVLDNLESAISGAWADDSVAFHKFGETVREITRDEFREARTPGFYRERGIFMTTNIDAVMERLETDRVAVVVTDLFQEDGDINAIVQQVKAQVFQRGLAAGIVAVQSPFDGTVFDAPGGSYAYASSSDPETYRPFYALMFGEADCLRRLADALNAQPAASDAPVLLLGAPLVQGFDIELDKTRDSRGINRRTSSEPDRFAFDLINDSEGGTLEETVVLTLDDAAPALNPDRLALDVYKKVRGTDGDSTATDDLRITDMSASGDTLRLTLQLEPSGEDAALTYLAQLRAGDIGGLAAPAWVEALSTSSPTAEVDPNKTLNLTKFVGDLAQASASARPAVVAQFIVDVTRR